MQVDPNYVLSLAGSLNNATATEAQLTGELSSGLRLTTLATDPVAAADSTLLSASISQTDSYVQASGTAQSRLEVTDSALGAVVSQLTSAITSAISGANATSNLTDKIAVSNQLSSIRSEVLGLANTTYLGTYVFGGSDGSTAPFAQNTVPTPQTTTYTGDSALQYTTTETGQKIQTNLPGSAVFTSAGSSVFGALNQAVADFAAGAPGATLQADTSALSASLQTVIDQRSQIDTSLNQLKTTSTYAQTSSAQLSASQSTLVAANTATVATQLSQVETQTQALYNTIAALEKGSLFDYLK